MGERTARTDGRTFETGFIRSTLSNSQPKNGDPADEWSRFYTPNGHGPDYINHFLNYAPNHMFGIGEAWCFVFRVLIDMQEY